MKSIGRSWLSSDSEISDGEHTQSHKRLEKFIIIYFEIHQVKLLFPLGKKILEFEQMLLDVYKVLQG